jgi:hypothetical protein
MVGSSAVLLLVGIAVGAALGVFYERARRYYFEWRLTIAKVAGLRYLFFRNAWNTAITLLVIGVAMFGGFQIQ